MKKTKSNIWSCTTAHVIQVLTDTLVHELARALYLARNPATVVIPVQSPTEAGVFLKLLTSRERVVETGYQISKWSAQNDRMAPGMLELLTAFTTLELSAATTLAYIISLHFHYLSIVIYPLCNLPLCQLCAYETITISFMSNS